MTIKWVYCNVQDKMVPEGEEMEYDENLDSYIPAWVTSPDQLEYDLDAPEHFKWKPKKGEKNPFDLKEEKSDYRKFFEDDLI